MHPVCVLLTILYTDPGDGQDLVEAAAHILKSQDALHQTAATLSRDNAELRDYVRALLPAAMEGREGNAKEKETLMAEYTMALNECKDLSKKVCSGMTMIVLFFLGRRLCFVSFGGGERGRKQRGTRRYWWLKRPNLVSCV